MTAWSALCAAGTSSAEILASLQQGRSGLAASSWPLPFQTVTGALPAALPPCTGEWTPFDGRYARVTMALFRPVEDAVRRAVERHGAHRVALVLASSVGGLLATEEAMSRTEAGAWQLAPAFSIPHQHELHAAVLLLRALTGIRGPGFVVSTACSASARAFGSARRMIRAGIVDAAVVAGIDTLTSTTLRGFHALGILSTRPSRPFSALRDGMNIGEGGALFLLERGDDAALSLLGVGESNDAFHMSGPHPEGAGAALALRRVLDDAGLTPADVDYVNAHGTGTRQNDAAESRAIATVLGTQVPFSSTKGYTGHLLGAAGAVEAAISLECLRAGWYPASLGSEEPDTSLPALPVLAPAHVPLQVVLSSSFGFGGSNAVLAFGRTP